MLRFEFLLRDREIDLPFEGRVTVNVREQSNKARTRRYAKKKVDSALVVDPMNVRVIAIEHMGVVDAEAMTVSQQLESLVAVVIVNDRLESGGVEVSPRDVFELAAEIGVLIVDELFVCLALRDGIIVQESRGDLGDVSVQGRLKGRVTERTWMYGESISINMIESKRHIQGNNIL